jgi:hypothetical protein
MNRYLGTESHWLSSCTGAAPNQRMGAVKNMKPWISLAFLASMAAPLATGCTIEEDAVVQGEEDDLTSVTARERALSFEGYVYVSANASDWEIKSAVQRETKSAFGALRTALIGVNDRELNDVDTKTFVKEPVTLVGANGTKTNALRVRYRYNDRALVPVSMATRSAIHLAVLHGNYQGQSKRVLEECTENTHHDQEFESSLWYVFNPSLSSCQDAINAENLKIQEARKGLTEPAKQIVGIEKDRLYIPITISLQGPKTQKKSTYPEYDRLWRGGVEKNKLIVSIVSGVMADWAAGEKPKLADDVGYDMYWSQMAIIQKQLPGLKFVGAEGADLTKFTANGKTVTNVKWSDLANWAQGYGYPTQFSSWTDRQALKEVVADTMARHWLRFEQPVSVKIGSEAPRNVTVVIKTYYAAETDDAPHRTAMKTSDVVIYNGHSYIGYGPLDPSRYSASDFPNSYQMFFFNSCVSFNYYEADFFKMHPGGSKNLDMITNGLESWVNGSGESVGRFVATLLNGKQATYLDLLNATGKGAPMTDVGIDGLRVVDGELDNKYKPSNTKITVTLK